MIQKHSDDETIIDFSLVVKDQLSSENTLVKQWEDRREMIQRANTDEFPIACCMTSYFLRFFHRYPISPPDDVI